MTLVFGAILPWLHELHTHSHQCPDPSNCRLPAWTEPAVTSACSAVPTPPRKRRCLAPISGNSKRSKETHKPSPSVNQVDKPGMRSTRTSKRQRPGQLQPVDEVDHDATPRVSRQRKQPLSTQTEPVFDIAASSQASSTRSSQSRGSSPVKRPADLRLLKKPIQYHKGHVADMRRALSKTPGALDLLSAIQRKAKVGYLPSEIEVILRDKLGMLPKSEAMDTDQIAFAPDPRAEYLGRTGRELLDMLQQVHGTAPAVAGPASGVDLALLLEFRQVCDVVAKTMDFEESVQAEPVWNENIHLPILNLAVDGEDRVAVDNITRATIAPRWIPRASMEGVSLTGKMVDYALSLRPDPELADKIARFLAREHQQSGFGCFNQTAYEPITALPTAVFLETKTDSKRYSEGQAQLGMWFASWWERVTDLTEDAAAKLHFVPLILVERESWKLFIAVDNNEAEVFDIYGHIPLGGTGTVEEAYRLVASLRCIVHWVKTDFHAWVEDIVGQ